MWLYTDVKTLSKQIVMYIPDFAKKMKHISNQAPSWASHPLWNRPGTVWLCSRQLALAGFLLHLISPSAGSEPGLTPPVCASHYIYFLCLFLHEFVYMLGQANVSFAAVLHSEGRWLTGNHFRNKKWQSFLALLYTRRTIDQTFNFNFTSHVHRDV